jgi:hypothetical protein
LQKEPRELQSVKLNKLLITPMTTLLRISGRSAAIPAAAALLIGVFATQATVVSTPPQVFHFGPAADNFMASAYLAAFDQVGTLLSVHLELSGEAAFVMTATSGANPGTVSSMTEKSLFSLTGLPFATPLGSASPTFSVAPFALAPNSSRSISGTVLAPLVSSDLTVFPDLNAYDVSKGAPAHLPFLFNSLEEFSFSKTGSGLFGGSDVLGLGTVTAWYTYENSTHLVPPPPPTVVPEMSSAVFAGAFALVGIVRLARGRMNHEPQCEQ